MQHSSQMTTHAWKRQDRSGSLSGCGERRAGPAVHRHRPYYMRGVSDVWMLAATAWSILSAERYRR